MRKVLLILTLLINTGVFGLLQAQGLIMNVQQYGLEDGLFHRGVRTVFEDKNGLIWLGSQKSLQRFDGKNFKTWTKADRTGLLYHISAIGQDDEGWLWLWNNDLLKFVFLHPETEEIMTVQERFVDNFPIPEKPGGWSASSQIPVDAAGKLYFLSKGGKVLVYDSKNGFQFIPIKESKEFRLTFIDRKGNLWGENEQQKLLKVDKSGQILARYDIAENATIGTFSEGNEGIYYIESEETIQSSNWYKISENGERTLQKKINRGFQMASGDYLWSWTPQGVEITRATDNALIMLLSREDYDEGIFRISTPFVDSRGKVWIFGRQGLAVVTMRPNRFKKFMTYVTEHNKLIQNQVRGIYVLGDTIFANLEHSGLARTTKNNPEDWSIIYEKEWPRPFIKKENNVFWIGFPFSIKAINTSGQVLEEFRSDTISGIWSFYEDERERLWVGTGDKLVYKNKADNFLQHFKSKEENFVFLERRGAIQNMIREDEELVWFCSWTGLYLFDTKNEKILARYAEDEAGAFHLPASIFYYLYKDAEGIYWLGTNEGLIKWTPEKLPDGVQVSEDKNTDVALFTRQEGLSNDVVYAIFEDDHNRLWLSSDFGIMSFDKTSYNVQSYQEEDGISHHEFNRTSQFREKDGTIYFGGMNGITAFHPDDFIEEKKDFAKMLITDFEIFDGNQEALISKIGTINKTKTIVFHPNDRFFRLKFVLPTFDNVDKILYAWKVEGVDMDWNYQKENSLQFGALPYGNHTLRIKGQSAGGGWSPHELAIEVQVLKPFYLQTWFILLSIFSLIAAMVWFVKRRTRLLKETQKLLETEIEKATSQIASDKKTIEIQAEELRQLDKVKSRFFANVSHELRTPLTLMLGPISSILKSNKLDSQNQRLLTKAKQGGKDLLKLVGSILDLSKMESGKMELKEQPTNLFQYTRRVVSAFESHAEREGINFQFNYTAEKDLQLQLDKGKLEIILNNLLSNALKFTPKNGAISVTIADQQNKIQISVKDTGRGIHTEDVPHIFNRFYQSAQPDAPTEGGTGIGLALSQELVNLMGGKIWVESELGKGSQFSFDFLRKEVLKSTLIDAPINEEIAPLQPNPATENKTEEAVKPSTNFRVLIVEDNHALRDYIKTVLRPHYEILTAENGQEALDILHQKSNAEKKPHLILSDIMMPVMDGYQLLKKLKTNDTFRHIPVVMLTARADIQDKLQALRIGVDDYLLKPFEEEELLARIDNLLQNYQERQSQVLEGIPETPESTSTPTISKEDEKWLVELEQLLLKELSNNHYSVTQLAYDIALSERQLRRRIKQLIGLSPSQYFKAIRLQQARELLEKKQYNTVAQTAAAVGFQDAGAFSRNFIQRFGKTPSDYLSD